LPNTSAASDQIQATGKRKSAIARVRLSLGSGQIKCNGRAMDE
jgi:ribosomal protein S9